MRTRLAGMEMVNRVSSKDNKDSNRDNPETGNNKVRSNKVSNRVSSKADNRATDRTDNSLVNKVVSRAASNRADNRVVNNRAGNNKVEVRTVGVDKRRNRDNTVDQNGAPKAETGVTIVNFLLKFENVFVRHRTSDANGARRVWAQDDLMK